MYLLDAVVRRVPADAWDSSSPCDEWTVRQVLGHTMFGVERIARGARGEDPPPEQDEAAIAGDDPLASWTATLTSLLEAVDQQGALQRQVETPFGTMPVDDVLGFFYGDALMHTWDIAIGVGIDHAIPDDLAEANLAMLQPMADALRGPGRLGPAVEPPPGATAVERMAAFEGRTVPT